MIELLILVGMVWFSINAYRELAHVLAGTHKHDWIPALSSASCNRFLMECNGVWARGGELDPEQQAKWAALQQMQKCFHCQTWRRAF